MSKAKNLRYIAIVSTTRGACITSTRVCDNTALEIWDLPNALVPTWLQDRVTQLMQTEVNRASEAGPTGRRFAKNTLHVYLNAPEYRRLKQIAITGVGDVVQKQREGSSTSKNARAKPAARHTSPEDIAQAQRKGNEHAPLPTQAEQDLLDRYRIPSRRAIWASARRGESLKQRIRDSEAWVAYGAVPCEMFGHTVRLRPGHCLACKPIGLQYLLRQQEAGYLYLARAGQTDIYKIGSASVLNGRLTTLNKQRYGGFATWKLVKSIFLCSGLGVREDQAHSLTKEYRYLAEYEHPSDGPTMAREMFRISEKHLARLIPKIFAEKT